MHEHGGNGVQGRASGEDVVIYKDCSPHHIIGALTFSEGPGCWSAITCLSASVFPPIESVFLAGKQVRNGQPALEARGFYRFERG